MSYRLALLALDLSAESNALVDRAQAVTDALGASLHLVHFVEPLSFAHSADAPVDLSDIQQQIYNHSLSQFEQIVTEHGLEKDAWTLSFGRPEIEIEQVAKELGADLILIGIRQQSGLAALLGSTTQSLIQNTRRDVLALHLEAEQEA